MPNLTSDNPWHQRYCEGIERANSEGHILQYPQQKDDFYSHLRHGLDGSNTRSLRPIVYAIAKACYASRLPMWSCLEVGPGAGRAMGQMHDLPGIRPETVSLNAINPYLRLRMGFLELLHKAQQVLQGNRRDRVSPESSKAIHNAGLRLKIATLMELQETGLLQSFESCQTPYIHTQHVGDFDHIQLPYRSELIFEESAVFRSARENGQDPIGVFQKLRRLLADEGTLILSPIKDPKNSSNSRTLLQKIELQLAENDIARVLPSNDAQDGDLIVARAGSPLLPLLKSDDYRQHLELLIRTHGMPQAPA